MTIRVQYPVIDMKKTGENIKRLREDRGISVREIQEFLGLEGPQAIYHWQNGVAVPSVDNLLAISHLFGVTMNEILVLADPSDGTSAEAVCHSKKVTVLKRMMLMMAA